MKSLPTTRRDRCYVIGRRAQKLIPSQAARAWLALARALERMGEKDVPKFNDLLASIHAAHLRQTNYRPMTRTQKIRKLASAIKDYRGAYNPGTGKWIRGPQPSALPRITAWLSRLDADIPSALAKIDGFETQDDCSLFLLELEEAKPSTHKP